MQKRFWDHFNIYRKNKTKFRLQMIESFTSCWFFVNAEAVAEGTNDARMIVVGRRQDGFHLHHHHRHNTSTTIDAVCATVHRVKTIRRCWPTASTQNGFASSKYRETSTWPILLAIPNCCDSTRIRTWNWMPMAYRDELASVTRLALIWADWMPSLCPYIITKATSRTTTKSIQNHRSLKKDYLISLFICYVRWCALV